MPETDAKKTVSRTGAALKVKDRTYTGAALKPDVQVTLGSSVLKNGTDYTVAYSNNVDAGTASFLLYTPVFT